MHPGPKPKCLFLELFLHSFDKKGKGFLISKVYFVHVRNTGGKQKENDLVKTGSTFPKPSLMCTGIHLNGFGLYKCRACFAHISAVETWLQRLAES